jgi:hypothetical protein
MLHILTNSCLPACTFPLSNSAVNVTAAKKVEGTAALVADSADASCPETCIADATIEIVIDGTCRYAVFTPKGTDCPVAAGTVTINATTGECC